jgi:hypothetical protein
VRLYRRFLPQWIPLSSEWTPLLLHRPCLNGFRYRASGRRFFCTVPQDGCFNAAAAAAAAAAAESTQYVEIWHYGHGWNRSVCEHPASAADRTEVASRRLEQVLLQGTAAASSTTRAPAISRTLLAEPGVQAYDGCNDDLAATNDGDDDNDVGRYGTIFQS